MSPSMVVCPSSSRCSCHRFFFLFLLERRADVENRRFRRRSNQTGRTRSTEHSEGMTGMVLSGADAAAPRRRTSMDSQEHSKTRMMKSLRRQVNVFSIQRPHFRLTETVGAGGGGIKLSHPSADSPQMNSHPSSQSLLLKQNGNDPTTTTIKKENKFALFSVTRRLFPIFFGKLDGCCLSFVHQMSLRLRVEARRLEVLCLPRMPNP